MQIVQSAENADKIVPKVIALYDRYNGFVTTCFHDDGLFQKAMKLAFEVFCNYTINITKENKKETHCMAEILSTHCDTLLKKGGTKKSEEEVEKILDSVVSIFTYVSDKDLFSEYYRKQLAKRLLLNRTENEDVEKNFILKLKLRCGAQFTSKLEGMIKDKNVSKEMNDEFHQSFCKNNPCETSVQVLTMGYWPSYTIDDLHVCNEMSESMEKFHEYYKTKTTNRIIRWIHCLGQVIMKGKFGKNTHELIISTYQACILMLFNHSKTLTVGEIQKTVNIPIEMIQSLLNSLSTNKFDFLTKTPEKGRIGINDIFQVNQNFSSKQFRIRVPWMSKITKEEKKEINDNVCSDRKHVIEAAIVRIMKSRRTMQHTQLIIEILQQLTQHFKPDPRMIKICIENLINKEYLERTEESSSTYNYLA